GGTPLAAIDTDNDGIENRIDRDSDNDGIIDYVEAGGTDSNGDGLIDGAFTDKDRDGWSDLFDSDNGGTALSYNDSDQDGLPDRLDLDSDNDGLPDLIEAGDIDADLDGRGDNLVDTDGDGWTDAYDPDNGGTALADEDEDADGLKNREDTDSDGDTIPDIIEAGGTDTNFDSVVDDPADTDGDGWADTFDVDNGGTVLADLDSDTDGKKDRFDVDSDNDGLPEGEEGCTLSGSLDYQYFASAPSGNTVDNIPTTNPDHTGKSTSLNIEALFRSIEGPTAPIENLSFRFTGFIDIPETETFSFLMYSSDGAKLYVDGTILVDNDGLQAGVGSAFGSRLLSSGRHSVTIELFFTTGVDPFLELAYFSPSVSFTTFPFTSFSSPSYVCDSDGDGIANYLDLDSDNDGITDLIEAGGVDTDGNGRVDGTFNDTDNDGWADTYDPDQGTALANPDTDGDTYDNRLDLDSDNDGLPDNLEAQLSTDLASFTNNDSDNDGLKDSYDGDAGGTLLNNPVNTDGADNPDYLDLDSDNDGTFDIDESTGLLTDNNNDGMTDGFIGTNGLDNDHGSDNYAHPLGNFQAVNLAQTFGDADMDYLVCPAGEINFRDGPSDGDCFQALDDFDGDGIQNQIDLDNDDDGLMDIEEFTRTTASINYEFYSGLPSGNTVDNIPTTGALSEANSLDFNIPALQAAISGAPATNYAIRFTGGIVIPAADTYTFYTESDDGSKLFIDGVEVVNNDDIHALQEQQGTVTLSEGIHEFMVLYFFETQGTASLSVSYQSSTITKTSLPFSLLFAIDDPATDLDSIDPSFDLDSDDDGIPDIVEAGGVDIDNDGRVDGTFTDTDNDGWSDVFDPDNGGTRLVDINSDNDNIPDRLDIDSDNDGIADVVEASGTDSNNNGRVEDSSLTDVNGNGWSDTIEPAVGGSLLEDQDIDNDGLKNRIDVDSDQDGVPDLFEAGGTALIDSNEDGQVDDTTDTDQDGRANAFDVANGGTALADPDTDLDGLKNRLDLDSDNDGLQDMDEGCIIIGQLDYTYFSNFTDTSVDNIPTINPTAIGTSVGFGIQTIAQAVESASNPENYALRFTGFINIPTTDTYTFTLHSSDGSKFYVDGTLLIDNDGLAPAVSSTSGSRLLSGGQHTVTFEVFYNSGFVGILALAYSTATQSQINVPFDWFYIASSSCDSDGDGLDDRVDLDSDNDGIVDIIEAGGSDTDNNGVVDTFQDNNNNGWSDSYESPGGANLLPRPDTDGDLITDVTDLDSDNDGIPDIIEAGGTDAGGLGRVNIATVSDSDGDGWYATFDPSEGGTVLANPDTDADGLKNKFDLDSDGDGIPDIVEAGGVDIDSNGRIDDITDTDSDGWANLLDSDNGGTALADADTDGDSHKNRIDLDSDNDGISDTIEAQPTSTYISPSSTDTDADGIRDSYDIDNGGTSLSNPVNTDGTDNPDFLDLDSNNDGVFDISAVNTNLGASSGQFNIGLLQSNGGAIIIFANTTDFSDPVGSYYLNSGGGVFTFDDRIKDFDNDYLHAGDLDYRDNFQGVPGGVPENLMLWLRGDVSSPDWNDLSGNNVNITFTGSPTLSTAINYQPAYTFTGAQSANTDLSINAAANPDLAVLAVYLPSQDNSGSVWGEKSTTGRYMIDAVGATQNQAVSTGSGFESDIDQLYGTNTLSMATIIYDDLTSNGSQVYVNGEVKRSFTSGFSGTTNALQIAASGDNGDYFNGQVAEVIVYNQLLSNSSERQSIESYLALKYGITLSNDTDGDNTSFESGEGDYIIRQNAPETDLVIWDASANTQFHNNVAGIFRNNYTNIIQRQSKSANSDAIVTIGLDSDSDGLEASNADNPSTMTDNLALLWGHDGEALYDQSENIDFDPLQVISRLNREWRVQEYTNNNSQSIGEVIVQFDVSGLLGPTGIGTNDESQIVLLVDQDGDFSAGATMVSQSFVTASDNLVNFQVDFQNGNYFTLASNEDNALPITLLSFDATSTANGVQLDWATADEENSSHFTIERSGNGSTYSAIGQVSAAGTSEITRAYTYEDKNPLAGNNYYRLKSHDITGETEYSEIRHIKHSGSLSIEKPYPNPVQIGEKVYLKLPENSSIEAAHLYAVGGRQVLGSMTINSQNELSIDTQKLKAGLYVLSINLGQQITKFKILVKQ
ncbi:PA14 domain-containing protein, partial [Roseivirga sp. E12]|uniref:PA14 domain-containing protein n=1 Tax=Roseivirga sp. E12 TaxID=2819237 RepID=UPI001ABCC512